MKKKCPYCAEEIQDEAVFCRFCKRDMGEVEESPEVAKSSLQQTRIHPGVALATIAVVLGGIWIWTQGNPGSGGTSQGGLNGRGWAELRLDSRTEKSFRASLDEMLASLDAQGRVDLQEAVKTVRGFRASRHSFVQIMMEQGAEIAPPLKARAEAESADAVRALLHNKTAAEVVSIAADVALQQDLQRLALLMSQEAGAAAAEEKLPLIEVTDAEALGHDGTSYLFTGSVRNGGSDSFRDPHLRCTLHLKGKPIHEETRVADTQPSIVGQNETASFRVNLYHKEWAQPGAVRCSVTGAIFGDTFVCYAPLEEHEKEELAKLRAEHPGFALDAH